MKNSISSGAKSFHRPLAQSITKMRQTLRNLIAQAKTEEAIKLLLQKTDPETDLGKRVIQLSARFQTYKRNLLDNLHDAQVLGVELANINRSLLELLEEWETPNGPPWVPKPPQPWLKWTGIGALGLAILLILVKMLGFPEGEKIAATATESQSQDTTLKDPGQIPTDTNPATIQVPTIKKEKTNPVSTRKIPSPQPVTPSKLLSIAIKSDQSTAATQTYRVGDFIRLWVQVSQPCYLRALYKLADGQVILLAEDQKVIEKDLSNWLELGYGFEVTEPTGAEALHVFAQSQPFEDLKTIEKDGYTYVPSGLPAALKATKRGLKPLAAHAENQLQIITQPK